MKTLAERLRFAMAQAGMSQQDLGERVGMSQPAISMIITGSRGTPRKVAAIAEALGVNALWLEDGRGEMVPPLPLAPDEQDFLRRWRQLGRRERQAVDAMVSSLLPVPPAHRSAYSDIEQQIITVYRTALADGRELIDAAVRAAAATQAVVTHHTPSLDCDAAEAAVIDTYRAATPMGKALIISAVKHVVESGKLALLRAAA